jgi:N-acetylmuramoyl-L-alanine amidase
MPAVCLELGYTHSSEDMRRLRAPEFRDVVADAVADAVVAFFAPEEAAPATG